MKITYSGLSMIFKKVKYCFLMVLLGNSFAMAQPETVSINQTDSANKKQGYWEQTYPNGRLMYEGYFIDDQPVGEMKRYYENGALQAILDYKEGDAYVMAKLFYNNGSLAAEGRYYNMEKDSTWNYYSYYDQTLALKEEYIQGKRNGTMEHYFSNGDVLEQIEWRDDLKHGPWVQYFADHTIKLKGNFNQGKLEGEFIINQENGSPYITGQYENDQPEGLWVFYNEDGTVDQELNYVDGLADEESIHEQQKELFEMIEKNKGKIDEPDEMDFLLGPGRQ